MPDLKQEWPDVKQRLQARFPILTDGDLDATHGDRAEILALLELQLGYSPGSAEMELDRLLAASAAG